jgi:hypothetical protein
VLLDEQATRDEVRNTIAAAAAELKAGDVFMSTYAGHGSQVPDFNSDEDDGADETLCLFDGMLIDDELYELWSGFADDVRIVMISDSCHSGTVSRAARRSPSAADQADPPPPHPPAALDIAGKAFRMNRELYARLGRQSRGPDERLLTRELNMPLKGPVLLVAAARTTRNPGTASAMAASPRSCYGCGTKDASRATGRPSPNASSATCPLSRPAPHPDRAGTGNAGSAGAVSI